MKRIMENLTKSHDKASQGNDQVKKNVSNNIDNIVNDYVSVDEGVTKDDDLCNVTLLYEDFVLKRKKDEQGVLVKSRIDGKFVQLKDSETNVEVMVKNIVSTFRRKVKEKRLHMDVTFAHKDNVSFHSKTSV
ncbi:hypothetical protein KIW84_054299 [Lathyrus oleraceus]|uniref:Uncharacterized protein n=1 Tax=Pisum sativum TaxID=3888 RepID=A0A9D4WXB3_PEA|nr:hypothetical protein KIW84_054299 [Pisum sativum]